MNRLTQQFTKYYNKMQAIKRITADGFIVNPDVLNDSEEEQDVSVDTELARRVLLYGKYERGDRLHIFKVSHQEFMDRVFKPTEDQLRLLER